MKNIFGRIVVLLVISLSVMFVCKHSYASSPSIVSKALGQPHGIIITPLNDLLMVSHKLTSNYGMAIILMTIFLRLMLSPLQYVSLKSVKKMNKIQPQLKLIKEKFKSDPEKVQKETLKLFKEKAVNPFMGFLPTLLQMPLFFAFYKLLRVSPNIVGANFAGWITDLSLPDHLYVLPILAGLIQLAVIYYSSRDSVEQKMTGKFQIVMSAVFSCVMLKMPVALLLYTITSSVSSLVEKGVINRFIG